MSELIDSSFEKENNKISYSNLITCFINRMYIKSELECYDGNPENTIGVVSSCKERVDNWKKRKIHEREIIGFLIKELLDGIRFCDPSRKEDLYYLLMIMEVVYISFPEKMFSDQDVIDSLVKLFENECSSKEILKFINSGEYFIYLDKKDSMNTVENINSEKKPFVPVHKRRLS